MGKKKNSAPKSKKIKKNLPAPLRPPLTSQIAIKSDRPPIQEVKCLNA
jgi:hypothetical protein